MFVFILESRCWLEGDEFLQLQRVVCNFDKVLPDDKFLHLGLDSPSIGGNHQDFEIDYADILQLL